MELFLLPLAVMGHVVFWVSRVNRVHGMGLHPPALQLVSGVCWSGLVCLPVLAIGVHGVWPLPLAWSQEPGLIVYLSLAAAFGVYALVLEWHEYRFPHDRPAALLSNHTTSVNLIDSLGWRPVHGKLCQLMSKLPGNQLLDLRVQQKTLRMARLPAALDELSIAHLSDLHMSGRLDKAYFQEICALTNELEPDLIAITGDIFDKTQCFDWVPETLGQLRARYGVYFVLGNHDGRIDHRRAREVLGEAGLIDMGSRWEVLEIAGERVLLAGNELPWFTPAAAMEEAPPCPIAANEFRLLLAHAPDQVDWARRWKFDLMLAGHTHGGQVRLPWLGPIIAPSRLGTRYASGTFHVGDTLMHVSRGTATLDPLRFNCPPELALLVLRSAAVLDAAEPLELQAQR